MQQPTTGTEAADRVADVLLSFSRNAAPIGVSLIARELKLSKAVVHRILQSLISRELVQYSPGSRAYRLGPAAVALGAEALRQLDIRSVARIPLMELRDVTEETTTLSLLSSDKRIYIEQFESPREIKMTVELGRMHPLHAGASSRAILAHLPSAFVDRVLAEGLESTTSQTITDPDALRKSLDDVRELGYSCSFGERQGDAASVAVPIFGLHHEVIGSISICGPIARFSEETVARFAPLLTQTAARISRDMDDRGRPPLHVEAERKPGFRVLTVTVGCGRKRRSDLRKRVRGTVGRRRRESVSAGLLADYLRTAHRSQRLRK